MVWTPEGFFAASPDGENLMGYVLNQGRDKEATFVSSGQLRKAFYRPDLIAKRIDGDEAAIAAAVAQVGDVRHILADSLPPEIELLSKDEAVVDGDYELKLKITPRAGGIGRVIATRNPAFAVGDLVSGIPGVQEYFSVTGDQLPPGQHRCELGSDRVHLRELGHRIQPRRRRSAAPSDPLEEPDVSRW